ncbi:MAG TPA: pitrilysin family protein [Xanthobacteraceae bacterium]|nr:pitrilysin family protein [Xanthobacteraceae bacterium]
MKRTIVTIMTAVALTVASAVASMAAKIERVTTPGGIEFWHVRDDTLPMISMEFAFRGGSTQDPADKAGTASMMAALLDEGAGDLDARGFQQRLEERAIVMSFSAHRDTTRGSLKTLVENSDEAFGLLNLALTKPRFDADAVERIRGGTLAHIRRRMTDPGDVAHDRWFARAFPNHPYGTPQRGSLESAAKVGMDDLRAMHRDTFARDNLKIATIGAMDSASAARLVDLAFARLPAKAKLAPVKDAAPQNVGERDVIEMDVPQTVVMFGGRGLKRADPDFVPAYVLNHILGGGSFSSRLYREVREKRGLAYSVYSYLAPMDHSGLFMGGVSTRNDRAAESLSIILGEIREIAEKGPTAEELAKAKSYLIGSFPLRFDSSSKIAGQLLEIQLENLGIDYIDRRNGLIEAVTAEDVKRAANRFLTDAKMLVTLVGRPDLAPEPARPAAPATRG